MKISCQEKLIPGVSFADKLKSIESYGFDAVELSGTALNDRAQLAERKSALRDSRVVASTICGGHPPISSIRMERGGKPRSMP